MSIEYFSAQFQIKWPRKSMHHCTVQRADSNKTSLLVCAVWLLKMHKQKNVDGDLLHRDDSGRPCCLKAKNLRIVIALLKKKKRTK